MLQIAASREIFRLPLFTVRRGTPVTAFSARTLSPTRKLTSVPSLGAVPPLFETFFDNQIHRSSFSVRLHRRRGDRPRWSRPRGQKEVEIWNGWRSSDWNSVLHGEITRRMVHARRNQTRSQIRTIRHTKNLNKIRKERTRRTMEFTFCELSTLNCLTAAHIPDHRHQTTRQETNGHQSSRREALSHPSGRRETLQPHESN